MAKYYKVIGNLKRPDGMSFGDFKQWWQQVHVPRVMKWAGLVAYDLNFALSENEAFDGVGIAWFDNKEAALRVFQTAEGQSARSGAVATTACRVRPLVSRYASTEPKKNVRLWPE